MTLIKRKYSFFLVTKTFLVITMFLIAGCSFLPLKNKENSDQLESIVSAPIWFSSRTLLKENFEYIGYGQGKTKEQAMLSAKSDLALSISSRVSYVIEDSIKTDGKTSSNKTQSHSKIESNLQLSNIKQVKNEVIHGITYSAYSYSNLPVVSEVFESHLSIKCTKKPHPYLKYTPLFKAVKQQLFINDPNCEPQMQVTYKNHTWYLLVTSTENKTKMFALGENDFSLLFARISSDAIKLRSSSSSLKEGDLYHFNMQIKPFGYLSLLYFSGDGQLSILKNNEWQNGDNNSTYPDLKLYDGLAAEANKQRYSQDLAILALCDNTIDLSNISDISIEHSQEKNQYQFNQVMQKIAKCKISSEIIKIQANKKQ